MFVLVAKCISQNLCVGTIDRTDGCSVIDAAISPIDKVFLPAMKATEQWGAVSKDEQKSFLDGVQNFCVSLRS